MIPYTLFLSPMVVAQRMPRLWWESIGGNPFGPRESNMMVSEKLDAVQRGAVAAQRVMVQSSMDVTLAAFSGRPLDMVQAMMRAPGRVTEAALRPAAQRVTANAKRLSKG